MSVEHRGLRLQASVSARERRLAGLLEKRGLASDAPALRAIVEAAQLLGSLELAGLRPSWEEVREAGAGAPESVRSLRRAREAVDPREPLTVDAIRRWHGALLGAVGFRRTVREREEAPPPAPPDLVGSRLDLLEAWLATPSARDLRPEQSAAVTLARIVEVLPFEDGNGRVSRLAASHVMVQGGGRAPILVAGDAPRLVASLQAAFRLETGPLSALLSEASLRALDVMIQSLERGEA